MFRYLEKPINESEFIKLVQISYSQINPIGESKFLPFAWMTNSQENPLLELAPEKDYT